MLHTLYHYRVDNFPRLIEFPLHSAQILSAVQMIVIARPEPPRRFAPNTQIPFLRQVQQPRNSYGAPTEPYGENERNQLDG